jgi:hypothetical protein
LRIVGTELGARGSSGHQFGAHFGARRFIRRIRRGQSASIKGQPPAATSPAEHESKSVAAIVDRVTFNAHILETGTQSYRLRTSKTTTRRKRAG